MKANAKSCRMVERKCREYAVFMCYGISETKLWVMEDLNSANQYQKSLLEIRCQPSTKLNLASYFFKSYCISNSC